MRLYTKRGDQGETGLIGGIRVPKNHLRVAAYGQIDELNAAIGWAASACNDAEQLAQLQKIQDQLFVLGSELANPGTGKGVTQVTDADASLLENWIDDACDAVAPLRQFILPGGSELAARLHLARTIGRRAERSVVTLSQKEPLRSQVLIYLNRLSDLLFAWARLANARAKVPDVIWNAPDTQPLE